MKYTLATCLLAGICCAGPALAETELKPGEISVAEARAATLTRGALLIDVRTPEEWAETGLAAGAVRLTLDDPDFIETITALTGGDTTSQVAFICRSGNRSLTARSRLMAAGYTQVTSVAGGMMAETGWKSAGLPTVADSDCGIEVTATC